MTQAPVPQSPGAADPLTDVNVMTQRQLDHLLSGPLSAKDVAGLLARKATLSTQLNSSVSRRRDLARQLRDATSGADKAGLEQRLSVLDGRIARLESDIDVTGKVLSTPDVARLTQQQPEFNFNFGPNTSNRFTDSSRPLMLVFLIFVLGPIAISVSRVFWKRGSLPRQAPIDKESAQRLERMEQSMDAIAIEIERVSEGQRFVTRLLAERRDGAALGAGQPAMEPVRQSMGEKARL
jgi:hypothetical protein